MSTLGSTGRVGLAVVLAIVLFVAMYFFFNDYGISNSTYNLDVLYNDATGASKGVPVELAGVEIGHVDDVTLRDQLALVRLKIKKTYSIPVGSKFRITSPLLGGPGAIAVTPPLGSNMASGAFLAPGSVIDGEHNFDFSSSLSQSNALLQSLTTTTNKAQKVVESLQAIVGDPKLRRSLLDTADNLSLATENGVKMTDHLDSVITQDNGVLLALLAESRTSAKSSLSNIAQSTAEIKDATTEDRSRLTAILDNMQDTTAALAGITTETNKDFENGHLTQNITAVVSNLKSSTDHLNVIAGNLEKLSTDPATDADIKATVHNIRETTAQSAFLLHRLNRITGNRSAPPVDIHSDSGVPDSHAAVPATAPSGGAPAPSSAKQQLFFPSADLLQNTDRNNFRADVGSIVSLGGPAGRFADLGIYGLGDANRFNMQFGEGLGKGLDLRGGLHASKLGLGADFGLTGNTVLSLDAYDPNHFRLDAQGVIMLNKSFGLIAGADNITGRAGPVVGVELRH